MIDYLNGFDDPTERHESALSLLFGQARYQAQETRCGIDTLVDMLRVSNLRIDGELSEREVYEMAASAYRSIFEDDNKGGRVLANPDDHFSSLLEEVTHSEKSQVFLFGIGALDESFRGLLPGETLSLVGAQGAMKTALALNGIDDFLEHAQKKVLFLSLDMPPEKIIVRRLMRVMNCDEANVREHIYAKTAEINNAYRTIRERDNGNFRLVGKTILNPKTRLAAPVDFIDLQDVLECIDTEAPAVMVIDFLTKIQAERGKPFRSDLEKAERIIPAFQRLAEKRKISMVILSQMGRANKTAAKAGDSGGHGKGGGIIEETVDAEIELLKDALPEGVTRQPPIIATVTKTRRGVAGKSFSLEYIGHTIQFTGSARRVQRATAAKPAFADNPGF
jgi:replicative DNA helicase